MMFQITVMTTGGGDGEVEGEEEDEQSSGSRHTGGHSRIEL